ncbi:metallophosphoesterase family protein [Neptunomonas japonica]|uniref:metallophosphoesterase family protein n=1 Tax=Neptunomonas japonica TaxID=417574 RepID=UPI0003F6F9C3|nr:metallophosphoesterase family protein [Neptunomonas japonica]
MTIFNPISTRPLLVFGGAYSNAQATQALIAEAQRLSIPPSNILCTGDLVAYCASPQETIDLIKNWQVGVVMGNCEESFGNDADDCGCGFEEGTACDLLSAGWFNFSKPRISLTDKQWMKALPRSIEFDFAGFRCKAIHGGIEQINQFIYTSDEDEIAQQLDKVDADIVFGGHCGIPFGKRSGNKTWLNAGVIGMPANDGTREGWYMLVIPTKEGVDVEWHRLAYDAQSAANTMQKVGLNTGYKDTLLTGIWPSTDVLPDEERSVSGQQLNLDSLYLHRK